MIIHPRHTSALPASFPECPLAEVYTELQSYLCIRTPSQWTRPYPKDHGFLPIQLPRPGGRVWALNVCVLREIQDSLGHLQCDSCSRPFPRSLFLKTYLTKLVAEANLNRMETAASLPDSTAPPLHHPLQDGSLGHICGRPVASQL